MLPQINGRRLALSIVIPLYNEEENLASLISAISNSCEATPYFLELVLVDDGSSDQTAKLAGYYARHSSQIRLLTHEQNRGLGATVKTGLDAARGNIVLYIDADLPVDVSLIPKLLAAAGPDVIVLGYRKNRRDGMSGRILSKGYNLLCRWLFGLRVRDLNLACKLIPADVLRNIELRSEGSFINVELLLECRRLGLRVAEIPLAYYPRIRGASALSRPVIIRGILREMFRYLFKQGRPR